MQALEPELPSGERSVVLVAPRKRRRAGGVRGEAAKRARPQDATLDASEHRRSIADKARASRPSRPVCIHQRWRAPKTASSALLHNEANREPSAAWPGQVDYFWRADPDYFSRAAKLPMLPATLQFLIAIIACAINERLQRKLDYTQEEVRVLKEVVRAIAGTR